MDGSVIDTDKLSGMIEQYGGVQKFAEAADCSRQWVYDVTAGRRRASIDMLAGWARVLGVTVDDLIIAPKATARAIAESV